MGWHRLNAAIDHAQELFQMRPSREVVHAAGRTDTGRVRSHNEDSYVIADLSTGSQSVGDGGRRFTVGPHGVLLAVSDGMGGAAAGEIASSIAIESLLKALDRGNEDDVVLALASAVERANADVWDAAQSDDRLGMGATVVAAVIGRKTAHVAWVGDSRLYLIRNGEMIQVTKDHSYVQMLVDARVLSREGAMRSPYRNIVLQAIGTKQEVSVGVARVELRQGDRFVLCSDGLTEMVDEADICEIVLSSENAAASCERLVDIANALGGEDNITVIVARVEGDDLEKAGDERFSPVEVIQDFAFV